MCLGVGTLTTRVSGELTVPDFSDVQIQLKRATLNPFDPISSLEQVKRGVDKVVKRDVDAIEQQACRARRNCAPRRSSGANFTTTWLLSDKVDESLTPVQQFSVAAVIFFAATLIANFFALIFSSISFGQANRKRVCVAFTPALTLIIFVVASLFYFLAFVNLEHSVTALGKTAGASQAKSEPGLGLLWFILGLSCLSSTALLAIVAHYCLPAAEVVNNASVGRWSKRASGAPVRHTSRAASRHHSNVQSSVELKNVRH